MVQEARALKTLSIEGVHGREDPFYDYFTGVEDATGLSDLKVSRKDPGEALSLFNVAQQALNRASALHREVFSRSRVELSRYEADLRGLTEEKNALKLLCGQRKEEIKDLRAELSKAQQDQSDLIEQKKKTALSQLSSAESELRGMKEKSSAQEGKIAELEARLASELVKAKSEAEKAKAEADAIVAIYRADAEIAQVQSRKAAKTGQTRAYWIVKFAKCQSQRETLEEIHARGFDLTEEIIKAKDLEADAGALAFDDDDDDDESKSGSESREKLDGEETAAGENQEH
ncbi:uncharacterized protein [Nicotiana tomentosiformis]|uniref:uncharacterized protein n=1 Tax=Nicotiana tomentosiformis TaxID=4098 RepID=UPI00388C3C9C